MFIHSFLLAVAATAQAGAPVLSEDDLIAPPMSQPELRVYAPLPFFSAQFESSDAAMNALWQSAVTNLESRQQTGFSRDVFSPMGPFWGDAYMIGRAYAAWAGDPAVLRAGVERVLRPSPVDDRAYDGRPLAAYSLLWPQMLHAYYEWTGDRLYARELADFGLSEWLTYYEAARDDTGLLRGDRLVSGPIAWLTGFPPEATPRANSLLNAIYLRGLTAASELARATGLDPATYDSAAQRIRQSFQTQLWEPAVGLFRDAPGMQTFSVVGNGLALGAGLAPGDDHSGITALVRRDAALITDRLRPLVVEACFRGGEHDLGYHVMAAARGSGWDCSVLYLLTEYVAGVSAGGPGWSSVQLTPRFPGWVETAELTAPLPTGRVTVSLRSGEGVHVLLPPNTTAVVNAVMGEAVMVKNVVSHGESDLAPDIAARLARYGWSDRVGDEAGVWVSVRDQMLRVVEAGRIMYQARCATAANGVGSEMDSLKTPAGWHKIVKKLGDGEPWGRVFRSRVATREIWRRGEKPSEDLVLTRVFLLDGLEPGLNKGGRVDSYKRNIYIHGTNDEGRLGTPSSHGCIRLSNDDVLEAYDVIPEDALVLITED
jgi:hypothetical protein